MSRREGRDSHGKRLYSKSEREFSPMKPRRDGKPATERTYSSRRHLDIVETTDRDQRQRRRLQDALSLEVPLAPETTVHPDTVKNGLGTKVDGPDDTKHSSDPTEVPRSRSHFQDSCLDIPSTCSMYKTILGCLCIYVQHDERSGAGQRGQSFGRKATDYRRWSDPKELQSDRVKDKVEALDLRRNDERTQSHADDEKVWKHDRFYELEAEAPPARKRPAFSEKKMPVEPESAASEKVSELVRLPREQPALDSVRRDERGHHARPLDKAERPFTRVDERNGRKGDVPLHRAEMQRPSHLSRERFSGGFMRGRDGIDSRYSERNTYRPGGGQVEKWKHDLFEETNRSPSPKNEEDQIAKVEALLAL